LDELRAALELTTEEELQQLTELLFSRKFNPLDYVQTPAPIDVQSRDRQAWLDAVEQRFRYLAADGLTVLRGRTEQVTYRQALIQVCRYLKIPYSKQLSTTDLEAEVFLHLMGRAWKRLPSQEQQALTVRVQQAIVESKFSEPLPISAEKDPLGLLFKGGSALAVSSVLKPVLLKLMTHGKTSSSCRHGNSSNSVSKLCRNSDGPPRYGGECRPLRCRAERVFVSRARAVDVVFSRFGLAIDFN